ncbi:MULTISPECIES: FecR family protein [unclassified Arenibacter]|uniref:FecR family protein n=1 Tax=unclassified Arenibacter TaxID=2615047 RepID=UPI000E34D2B6|nr:MULTISPECIES: FecR family protein [unclassified Arenibacter]MCM4164575.1 anti-sigma factor [Arenibacter sp. A80]RFT55659.1 FecR family protein [Arenibacter sp. P308M17]
MNNSEAKALITKFLTHQASVAELDELVIWLQDDKNEKLFSSYVQTNFAIEHEMRQFDANKLKSKLEKLMVEEKKAFRVKKWRQIGSYAAAAVVAGLLVTGFLIKDKIINKPEETTPRIVNNNIEVGSDKATLTLEDGSQVSLERGSTYQTQNAHSNGEEIVYLPKEGNITKVANNILTIPRGGLFHLVLSDKSEVWLNSESQLKYPVSFVKGQPRIVELVYGEGYFVVSPSTEHGDAKFIVANQSQEIEVLGTEFNIKAYKDESNIYTTLVEGKVSVSTLTTKKMLKPSQQANLNLIDNSMDIGTVNVYSEISWKDGVFSFRRKPLLEIMKVLSRWYDIDVNFEDPKLEKALFNGALGKDQNIEDILNTIKNFGVIKDYEIINKTILLK